MNEFRLFACHNLFSFIFLAAHLISLLFYCTPLLINNNCLWLYILKRYLYAWNCFPSKSIRAWQAMAFSSRPGNLFRNPLSSGSHRFKPAYGSFMSAEIIKSTNGCSFSRSSSVHRRPFLPIKK